RTADGRNRGDLGIVATSRTRHAAAMTTASSALRPARKASPLVRRAPMRIAALAFPDVQALDIMGPLEVFSRAARWMRDAARRADLAYQVEIIGAKRGEFRASSGLRLFADRGFAEVGRDIDTLLISGGIGVESCRSNAPLLRWIRGQSRHV